MDTSEKERLVRAMAGAAGSVGDPVPLMFGEEPLDEDKWWLQFRDGAGWELDELRALLQREQIERRAEGRDGDLPQIAESRHVDGRIAPILWKAIQFGLITDAVLPDKDNKDELCEYRWSNDTAKNLAWAKSRKGPMFYALLSTVLRNTIWKADDLAEDVVAEGEESAEPSEKSSPEPESL